MAIRFELRAAAPPRAILEIKLKRDLHQARISRPLHATEIGSVGDVAIRIEELRMVRNVEEVPSEFDSRPFVDAGALL